MSPEPAPFKDHFSRLAAHYSAFRPLYPPDLFDYLSSLCSRKQRAWDCACGSGQATLALAEKFASVTGTDASPQQIEAAKPHPKVTYYVGTAQHSGLETSSMDLVTVAQALHWFDLESFYHEVRRVLCDAGVLAVWCYGVLHVEGEQIDPLLQKYYYHIIGPYWPPERQYVDDGYRDLPFPFPELTPPGFNMEARWSLPHLLGYLRSWSATGSYIQRHGLDPVAALEEQLEPEWGDARQERRVTWPLSLRVGRKPAMDNTRKPAQDNTRKPAQDNTRKPAMDHPRKAN
jgi:SAM-dependent methyltransferase